MMMMMIIEGDDDNDNCGRLMMMMTTYLYSNRVMIMMTIDDVDGNDNCGQFRMMTMMTIGTYLYPKRVTSSGFPPKCFIFCCNHFKAAIWATIMIFMATMIFITIHHKFQNLPFSHDIWWELLAVVPGPWDHSWPSEDADVGPCWCSKTLRRQMRKLQHSSPNFQHDEWSRRLQLSICEVAIVGSLNQSLIE